MLKSVIWSSMLDYPGKVCTTLFFEGCNFACEYCQNKELKQAKSIDFETEILPLLIERQPLVNHIILSGGECSIDPTIQKIIDTLYQKGFQIGIHTNGYKTEFLEMNLDKISYIGMDIKNSFTKYDQIAGKKVQIHQIEKSINLIIQSRKEYEFRTTVYPKFVKEENCIEIAKYLGKKNAKNYVLQQYRKVEGIDTLPFDNQTLEQIARKCNQYVPTKLRGLIK